VSESKKEKNDPIIKQYVLCSTAIKANDKTASKINLEQTTLLKSLF
jgi:hypothetical protein